MGTRGPRTGNLHSAVKGDLQVSTQRVTRALAQRLARSKGQPVRGLAFLRIPSDSLTLSSFAARTAARDQVIKERVAQVLDRVQAWEQGSGQTAEVEVRPDAAAVAITAPAALFETLAEDDAIAALDLDAA